MILHYFLLVLPAACVVSCAFWLVALGCLHRVLRSKPRGGADYSPMVSILKPVKGVDFEALANFTSFAEQNYPNFELLFGVADRSDPVVKLVDQLRQRFPKISIRLFMSEPLGTNPKAATLHRLAAEARGEVLVIADSDIRVTPDFLSRVVAPLADPKIGLVTCLYRGQCPQNLSARLEALHMDAAFAPSVALAWLMGTDVGLGATVVMRRLDLTRAGGYAGCADHLLDDYEIAVRIAKLGLRIQLSDYVVASVLGPMDFRQQWSREVRWSRGIRAAHPLRYSGMIITFALPLALVTALLTPALPWAWTAVVFALAVRLFVAWRSAVLLQQPERRYLIWVPLRDLLSLAVWCTGMVGRYVTWRGRVYSLGRDGRLRPVVQPRLPTGLLAQSIRRLDAHLRRCQGIFEFTQDSGCVLRVHVAPAEADLRFPGGLCIPAGEPVGVLHIWNEHLALIPPEGPDLAWAMSLRRSLLHSLRELAEAAEQEPRLTGVRAFGGNAVFVSRNGDAQISRMAARYGFAWIAPDAKPGIGRRIHDFFENFLILGLQWAFNPGSIRGKPFVHPREPLWIPRQLLLEKYLPSAAPAEQAEPVAIVQ